MNLSLGGNADLLERPYSRLLRYASPLEVQRRAGDDDATRVGETHVDHVAVDRLDESNARVEAALDDVHESIVDANVDLHRRITLGELRQQTSEHERHRRRGHAESHTPSHFAGPRGDGLQGLEGLVDRRPGVLEEALPGIRERHAA